MLVCGLPTVDLALMGRVWEVRCTCMQRSWMYVYGCIFIEILPLQGLGGWGLVLAGGKLPLGHSSTRVLWWSLLVCRSDVVCLDNATSLRSPLHIPAWTHLAMENKGRKEENPPALPRCRAGAEPHQPFFSCSTKTAVWWKWLGAIPDLGCFWTGRPRSERLSITLPVPQTICPPSGSFLQKSPHTS